LFIDLLTQVNNVPLIPTIPESGPWSTKPGRSRQKQGLWAKKFETADAGGAGHAKTNNRTPAVSEVNE